MDPISEFTNNSEKEIETLKSKLKTIRSNRINAAVIESILVEAYPQSPKLHLYEIATITNKSPSQLLIIPFDSTVVSEIEKALISANLGATCAVQGNQIILTFPPLSQELRQKIVKSLNQIIEETRQTIRGLRDIAKKQLKTLFEEKIISEDVKFRQEKILDEKIKEFLVKIESLRKNKTEEIINI